jgi:hypothetical protein
MNRTLPSAMALLCAIVFWASPPSRVSVGAPENSVSNSKGNPLHLPTDTVWISIDDEDKPFRLKYLNQNFDAESLIEFLHAYVSHCAKKNETPDIVVESLTKASVDGEDALNDCLNQIAVQHCVTVVYLPLPIGRIPDQFLKFADEFKKKKSVPAKGQRTKR